MINHPVLSPLNQAYDQILGLKDTWSQQSPSSTEARAEYSKKKPEKSREMREVLEMLDTGMPCAPFLWSFG